MFVNDIDGISNPCLTYGECRGWCHTKINLIDEVWRLRLQFFVPPLMLQQPWSPLEQIPICKLDFGITL